MNEQNDKNSGKRTFPLAIVLGSGIIFVGILVIAALVVTRKSEVTTSPSPTPSVALSETPSLQHLWLRKHQRRRQRLPL